MQQQNRLKMKNKLKNYCKKIKIKINIFGHGASDSMWMMTTWVINISEGGLGLKFLNT